MSSEAPQHEPPGYPPPGVVVEARPVALTLAYASTVRPRALDLPGLTRRDAVLDLLLILLITLILPFGFELAIGLFLPGSEEAPIDPNLLFVKKWFDAALAVALVGYLLLRHRLPAASFGLRTEQLGQQGGWALTTLGGAYVAMIASSIVVFTILKLYPPLVSDLDDRKRLLEAIPHESLSLTLLLMLPVAVHEELVFRGLLLPYLHRVGVPWWLAVVGVSGVFASLHITQGVFGVFQVFFLGLVLSVGFLLSRSVLSVALAHFVFNVLQVQLARILLPFMEKWGGGGP